MDCQTPDADPDTDGVGVGEGAEGSGDDVLTGQLRAALASLSGAFTTRVRLIRVVYVLLAHYAGAVAEEELLSSDEIAVPAESEATSSTFAAGGEASPRPAR